MSYSEKSIKVLKGLKGVRQNPTMYIGSTGDEGINQIVKEAVDNAVDEYFNQNNKSITLVYDKANRSILVSDLGRGIPVKKHKDSKISTMTTVLTVLHAGGKFHGKGKEAYSVSSGLHGVGLKASNALSSLFEVWTHRENNWWYQEFHEGKPVKKKPVKINKSKLPLKQKKGTIVRMVPDKKIFKKSVFDFKKFVHWFEDLQYLLPGLSLTISNMKKEKTFISNTGLEEFVGILAKKNKSESLSVKHGKPVMFKYKSDKLDIAMFFGNGDEEIMRGYTNSIYNSEGGFHISSIQSLMANILSVSTKKPIVKADLRAGLISVLHIKLTNAQYGGQTKQKLVTKEAEKIILEEVTEPLTRFFRSNQKLVTTIIQRAVELKKIRDSVRKDKDALKNIKVSRNSMNILPGKLASAPRCKPEDRELFICEGDSASGSLINGRDSSFQEVLPLKGKIINAAKATTEKLFMNDEVKALIAAIGCDLKSVDSKKARVGKLVIVCFPGSTKVRLLDGRMLTMKEMYKLRDDGEELWVYAVDSRGKFVPAKVTSVNKTIKVKKLAKIKFSNGEVRRSTLDHGFMVNASGDEENVFKHKGNSYVQAQHLMPGQSLKTVYTRENHEGRRSICIDGKFKRVSRWVAGYAQPKKRKKLRIKTTLKNGIRRFKYIVHHVDRNKSNDNPSNLEVLTKSGHSSEHSENNWGSTYNGSKKHLSDIKRAREKGHYDGTSHFIEYNKTNEHRDNLKKAHEEGKYEGTSRFIEYNKTKANSKSTSELNGREDVKTLQNLGKLSKHYLGLKKLGLKINKKNWESHINIKTGRTTLYNKENIFLIKAHIKDYGFSADDAWDLKPRSEETKRKYPMQAVSKFVGFAKIVLNKKKSLTETSYNDLRIKLIRGGKLAQGTPKFGYGIGATGLEGQPSSRVESFVNNYNLTVDSVTIVKLKKLTQMYCLTVESTGNFCIDGGLKNRTPLRKGEENRIYANIVCRNCDADVDGFHIEALVLAFITKFYPELIEAGMVYTAITPLYKASYKGKNYYGNNLQKMLSKFPKGSKPITSRFKGLGECNPNELAEFALNPETRKIMRFKYSPKQPKKVEEIMGSDTAFRKILLGIGDGSVHGSPKKTRSKGKKVMAFDLITPMTKLKKGKKVKGKKSKGHSRD